MKILHTSDWHLGQNLMFQDRSREHKQFLLWLIHLIEKEAIDLIIVTGDIFDTATPPNYALKLYFHFLASLNRTTCKDVIIISGNHDTAATLNAPKQLLKLLDIHVIASGSDPVEEQVVITKDDKNIPTAVICAVPFLRDHDIRKSFPGESFEAKNRAITKGIQAHYELIEAHAQKIIKEKKITTVPLIATGHLFAVGGKIAEDEHIREIHVGSIDKFNINRLPNSFDYVAIGHLHKCQKVSGSHHIRYSGSPIPLSFGEAEIRKKVLTIDFKGQKMKPDIIKIDIPLFQSLVRLSGGRTDIVKQMSKLKPRADESSVWVEIIITKEWEPLTEDVIKKEAQDLGIKVFAIKKQLEGKKRSLKSPARELDHFSPQQIFENRLDLEPDLASYKREELILAFKEIVTLVREDD
jgi:DNA repair protein SbcD/Mre11